MLEFDLIEQNNYRAECEKMVLSMCLIAPEFVPQVMSIVQERAVRDPALRKLFKLINLMSLNRDPITIHSVLLICDRNGLIEDLGGNAGYAKLAEHSPNAAHYQFYANELVRLDACDRIMDAAIKAAHALSRKDCDPNAELAIFKTGTSGLEIGKSATPMGEVLTSILESNNLDDVGECFETGFLSLDRSIGGLYKSTLILLGGRFGKGKSCLSAQLVSSCVNQSKSSLIFSLEMREKEFGKRILSMEGGISMNAWLRKRNDAEQQRIADVIDGQKTHTWSIDDNTRQTVNTIRAKCELQKARGGLDLVVIDNLQLLSPIDRKPPKDQQYKSMTEELKRIARDLDVAILLLCQLDTDAGEKRPTSTSWATCKSIEGDADVAMIIHEMTQDDLKKEAEQQRKGKDHSVDPVDPKKVPKLDYQLILTKVRSQGKAGTLRFSFDGEFQRFEDVTFASLSKSFSKSI